MPGESKIRISVVSYLNSKPFLYGLRNAGFHDKADIREDIPSVCADKLLENRADIGLVPVAVLPKLKNYSIISDYCIGANGPVNSVLLLSDVPLTDIKTILLDYQSRTSVMLARVLAGKFWEIDPFWENTNGDFEKKIGKNIAGVVIGDRALFLKNKFKYVYDLSAEWKKYTGLPFVFACWVSIKDLESGFVNDFNTALKIGLENIHEIAEVEKSEHFSKEEITHYLENCIDYNFDDSKKTALKLFLQLAQEIEKIVSIK